MMRRHPAEGSCPIFHGALNALAACIPIDHLFLAMQWLCCHDYITGVRETLGNLFLAECWLFKSLAVREERESSVKAL